MRARVCRRREREAGAMELSISLAVSFVRAHACEPRDYVNINFELAM